MEKLLPLYGMATVLMLAAIFLAVQTNGMLSHKLEKIRLRTDESRRKNIPEPREGEIQPDHRLEWLIIGAMLLLICMLLSKV